MDDLRLAFLAQAQKSGPGSCQDSKEGPWKGQGRTLGKWQEVVFSSLAWAVNHPATVPLEIYSTEITEMFTAGIYKQGNWKHPKCLPIKEALGYPWKERSLW